MTEKRGRGGPPRKHKPHRHGPEGTAYPPPGPSSYRQPCVAGLKSRSAAVERAEIPEDPAPSRWSMSLLAAVQGRLGELQL